MEPVTIFQKARRISTDTNVSPNLTTLNDEEIAEKQEYQEVTSEMVANATTIATTCNDEEIAEKQEYQEVTSENNEYIEMINKNKQPGPGRPPKYIPPAQKCG